MLNYWNLGKEFFEFEKTAFSELSKIEIKGFNAWRIIKTPLFFEFIKQNLNEGVQEKSHEEKNKKGTVKKISILSKYVLKSLKGLFTIFFLWVSKKKKGLAVIITFSGNKTFKDDNGLLNDILVDGFIQHDVFKNYVYIEITDNREIHKKKAYVKSDILTADYEFIYKILLRRLRNKKLFFAQSRNLTALINTHFKKYGLEMSVESCEKTMNYFYAEYLLFSFLFRVLQPEVLLSNEILGTGIMGAAQKKGIRIIELQHGLMDEYYPQYQLNPLFLKTPNTVIGPDMIAVFGAFHKHQLISKKYWQENEIYVLGKKHYRSEKKSPERVSSKMTILFPSQGNALFQQTQDLLVSLIKLIKGINAHLILKLHPSEKEEAKEWYYSFAEDHNDAVTIIHLEKNINEILPGCDIVMGYHSTVLFEAVALAKFPITLADKDLPLGINSLIGENEFLGDVIKVVQNLSEVEIILNHITSDEKFCREWMAEINNVKECLYASNYENNCRDLINKLSERNDRNN